MKYFPNTSAKNIFINTLNACIGLTLFAIGVYMTIQANIGISPWDAFSYGISKTLGITFGNACIAISFGILEF